MPIAVHHPGPRFFPTLLINTMMLSSVAGHAPYHE